MFEDLLNLDQEITREHLVLLYVIKTLNELTDMGILQGKPFELTEKALTLIEEMDQPTDKELEWGILVLKSEGYIQ